MVRSMFSDDFPLTQFALIVLVCLSSLMASSLIGFAAAVPIFGINPLDLLKELESFNNMPLLKYFQVVQAIGLFILPAILLSRIFAGNSSQYLKMNKIPESVNFFIVIIIMLAALPVINLFAELNSHIKFPGSMSGLQQFIEQSSKNYQVASEMFLKEASLPGMIVNVFIIALLPALGEELLFRGIVQRVLCNLFKNNHTGIFVAGFLFSFMHFEFYAFFPRWALGIMFGYLLLWSGSIWLPILAHFLNNSIAVITYFLINNGSVDKRLIDFGSSYSTLPYTIFSAIVLGMALYTFYRRNRAPLAISNPN